MRFNFKWARVGSLLLALARTAQAQGPEARVADKPVLSTGVTGSIDASGLDDPQYVLSFVPIQRLLLEAAQHPVTSVAIQKALQGTPVTLDHLLQLELLRKDKDAYQLNYLLLTIQDQQLMYRVSARYGQSLSDAFQARKADFDEIIRAYPNAAARPQLLFDLVAGVALNWGGLALTTELGYRIQPPRHANGSVYFVHSAEVGAPLDFSGLYLDSETAPGSKMSFSTFGDGLSSPRLQGLPDVFEGIEAAVEDWKKLPDVYASLRTEYITLFLLAVDDAGQVMNAVANGADTGASLAKALSIPEERQKGIVGLLLAIGYLREANHRYFVAVPVLTENDKPLVEATLKLSREIMTEWLRRNYPTMRDELASLSPMRSGVPFSLAFSEVWHYEFGFATKSLAESGFYANPRASGNRYEGYVPLVWASSTLKGPGN